MGRAGRRQRPYPAVRALFLVCLSAVATASNYTNHGPLLGLIGDDTPFSLATLRNTP